MHVTQRARVRIQPYAPQDGEASGAGNGRTFGFLRFDNIPTVRSHEFLPAHLGSRVFD
jgi:hypothetical protein